MEMRSVILLLCSFAAVVSAQGHTTTVRNLTTDADGITKSCGGYLTQSQGEFSSLNYPDHYPNNINCTWRIMAMRNGVITINFHNLSLENHQNCAYDSVSVYNGPTTSSPLLAKMCGNRNNSVVNSIGNDMTVVFKTDSSGTSSGFYAEYSYEDRYSCRYNCGYNFGSCSCASSCQRYGNCCHDYYGYCTGASTSTPKTSSYYSCRYNCGYNFGSCSCTSSCQRYGNCCSDYNDYCYQTTQEATTAGHTSCRYNCGYNFGSCSCTSSCQRYGNCCHDYNDYCYSTSTAEPATTNVNPQCGGYLSGSGSFSSPYYPNYYHDNAHCVWRLSAPSGQRILLTFADLELDRCCDCDYITVYDGPSVYYSQLGQLCHNSSLDTFHSSSSDMTVLFKSDSSGGRRGFRAEFISSLSASKGRVECSLDNMTITVSRSFLSSEGFSGNDLYVNDAYCRPSINSYEVIFRFPLNRCGTTRKIQNGGVIYNNDVRTYPNNSAEITYLPQFFLSVACHMEKDSISQIMYVAHDRLNFNVTGTGRFNTTMAFYTSSNFYQQIYNDPYYVSLNEYMYVQVRLGKDDRSLVLFLDTCVASPNPLDYNYQRSHYLLANGCPRDSTYGSYTSGSQSYARFRFRAFKFLRTHPSVYLQCKVLICPANDYNSRCRQGCRTRETRGLDSELKMTTVVLGPIMLKDVEKLHEENVVLADA